MLALPPRPWEMMGGLDIVNSVFSGWRAGGKERD